MHLTDVDVNDIKLNICAKELTVEEENLFGRTITVTITEM